MYPVALPLDLFGHLETNNPAIGAGMDFACGVAGRRLGTHSPRRPPGNGTWACLDRLRSPERPGRRVIDSGSRQIAY